MTTAYPWGLWSGPEDADNAPGQITPEWLQVIEEDNHLRNTVLVAELVFGDGTRHRVATKPVDIVTASGQSRRVQPGLLAEPELDHGYDFDQNSAGVRQVALQVAAWAVGLRERLATGLPLQGHGELSLVAPGLSWSDRRVLLRGTMAGGLSFGADRSHSRDGRPQGGGVVSLALKDPRLAADVDFPRDRVWEDSWDDPHPTGIGKPYPILFGQGITQCVRVDDSTSAPVFVAALGHGWDVNTVWRNDEELTADFTAADDYDERGVAVTTVTYTGGVLTWEDGDRVEAELVDEDRVVTLDALQVARDMLETYGPSGSMISAQLFSAAQSRAGVIPSVGQVNTTATLLSWVESGHLDDYPMVSWIWAWGRYGPVVTDYRAPVRLDVAPGRFLLDRLTDPVETPTEELYNRFRARFAHNGQQGAYEGVSEVNETNSRLCRVSQGALKYARMYPEIQSIQIPDAEAADRVMDWLAAHRSLPSYYLEYAAMPWLFLRLQLADVVTLTDEDFGWSEVRCTVERLTFRPGRLVMGLRVWGASLVR